jgi:hypothetical protein
MTVTCSAGGTAEMARRTVVNMRYFWLPTFTPLTFLAVYAVGLTFLLLFCATRVHADPVLRLAQNWDTRAYGDCVSVGSDNVGPLLVNKCDIYLAVRYTDNNQCRIGCKVYIHAHDSGRIESSDHVHVEACRSPAFPQMQNDGTYVCKPTR